MSRKTIISLLATAAVVIPCLALDTPDATARSRAGGYRGAAVAHGGAYRGGAYRGAAYRGGAYRSAAVYRGGAYRGAYWRPGVGAAAVGVGAAAVGAAAAGSYYNSQPCGYYPYPAC